MSGPGKGKKRQQSQEERLLAQLAGAANRTAAAHIAAGIIAGAKRPHTIREALDVLQDVQFSITAAPWNPAYKTWVKAKEQRLKRPYE